MMWPRATIIVLTAALLLSACNNGGSDEPDGQAVEIFAGGGTDPSPTQALDAKLGGEPVDLDVGRDGVVRLLTEEQDRVTIWVFRADGSAQRIDLDPKKITAARQLATAEDGTMYVSHFVPQVGLVSKVDASGKLTPVVGNGREGVTADGGNASGPSASIDGITVDRQGRLVYGEQRDYGNRISGENNLLRRVEANGKITTIAGRLVPRAEDDYVDSVIRSVSPPAGTKAIGWPLPGLDALNSLATADDGSIVAQLVGGVASFGPDGMIRAVARRRDRDSARIADRPFHREGDAADAFPLFFAGLTEDRGYVSMPALIGHPYDPEFPAAFRWKGSYSPGQQAIIDAVARRVDDDDTQHVVRLVLPDGSLTTAAWAAGNAAVRSGRLYLLINSDEASNGQLLIGRVNLPS